MRRALTAAAATVATTALALSGAPAAAQDDATPSVVDVIVSTSGDSGFDHDGFDYDILREALVAADLVDAVAASADVTIFAPNDWAFIRLARDLGYGGWLEDGAFEFVAGVTGYNSPSDPGLLDDVLLYHVAPGASTLRELNERGDIPTLLGADATVSVVWNKVIDGDADDDDARIYRIRDLETSNGIVHNVSRVLRPLDLEPAEVGSIVDVVLAISGDSGTDADGFDYDLLRDALLATNLADAVASADDITVFAPNDWAFIRLARDLGYEGWDEAGAFGFIAAATGYVSADDPGLLDDVLRYHVVPGARTLGELRDAGNQATLLDGATVKVVGGKVVDLDPTDRDARTYGLINVAADNGIVHNVSAVLRPLDL